MSFRQLRILTALRQISCIQLVLIMLTCSTFAETDESEKIQWLMLEVSEKERVFAPVAWLERHLVDKEHSVSQSDLSAEIEAAGVSIVPTESVIHPPYATVGRLFSNRGNLEKSSCTGFFVGESLVMTAAHCVMDLNGRWRSDLVFVTNLGTSDMSPHGVKCVAVPQQWGAVRNDQGLSFDYAFLQLDSTESHAYLTLDFSASAEPIKVVGYRSDCCGNNMIELFKTRTEITSTPDYFVSANNLMGMGSSGSPWISTRSGKVVSLNAQYEQLGADKLNGPRFNETTRSMMRHIAETCQ